MAPTSFFQSLRRRSRASFRTDRSTDDSSEGAISNGTGPTSGSATPSSIAQQSDPALHLQVNKVGASTASLKVPNPQARPPLAPITNTSRYSVTSMSGIGASSIYGRQGPPLSQYAPRISNISDNAWVFQKALLIHGTIGDPAQHTIDGTFSITRVDDSVPPSTWPVCESHFKALIYLQPGPNKLRFEFSNPKLANSSTSNLPHISFMLIHMIPNTNSPPLQLAILLGKDSPATFDTTPARAEREGNGLAVAISKYRMAAYLWQAFTAEQMHRAKLGRRTFQFEEEWTSGTVNPRDREFGTMRSEARIHVIRSNKTVAELRDLDKAQQYGKATNKNALFNIAAEEVRTYFAPLPGQKLYVSVLLMDSHWDTTYETITGHAALGSGDGDLKLAIFGSHCLHSYPANIEEIVPAFTDCTPTDSAVVANDCNDAGSSWECANVGIGAHLHEVGHLYGCPHQTSGIMLRDYLVLNRSFVTREAYCTRTKSKGGFCGQKDECEWHKLDLLRFRAHPAFRLPSDPSMSADDSIQAYPVEDGKVMLMAATGISIAEIYTDGDDLCRAWIEYPADGPPTGQSLKQVPMTEQELRHKLPDALKKARLRVSIKSHGGGSLDIADFKEFASKTSHIKLLGGNTAFRSAKLGHSRMDGSEPQEVVFASVVKQARVLTRVVVYHGLAVDGLEFFYDNESSQLFGKRGGKEGGDNFDFDIRRGEYITGFYVRAGYWIDGIQILTSLGRRSPIYGKPHGGDSHTLVPPRGYTICGVSGSCGAWLDGFSILIKR